MRAADRKLAMLVERQTAHMRPALARAYMRAIARLAQEIGATATAASVASLRVELVVTDAMLSRAMLEMQAAVRESVQYSTRMSFGTLPSATPGVPLSAVASPAATTGGITFGVLNPRIAEAAQRLDEWLLPTLRETTRETVRRVIERGILNGTGPRALIPEIRNAVGLAPSHLAHVDNFRRRLETAHTQRSYPKALTYGLRDRRNDRTLWNALHSREPLSRDTINTMVAAYRNRYKGWHAEVIARTATLNAQREGQRAAAQSAVDAGLLPAERMTARWVTVGDDRVRDEHRAMNGETVPLGQAFSNGLTTPNEFNCRCIVAYELKPDSAVRNARPAPPPAATPTRARTL